MGRDKPSPQFLTNTILIKLKIVLVLHYWIALIVLALIMVMNMQRGKEEAPAQEAAEELQPAAEEEKEPEEALA